MIIKNNDQKGFTLVELMIVIAIIGILAAIAIPNFMSYQKKGYNARARSQAKNLYTAVLAYLSDPDAGAESFAVSYYATLPGFVKDDDVVIAGGNFEIDNNGNLAVNGNNATFKHNKGDKTYTLAANGAITGS